MKREKAIKIVSKYYPFNGTNNEAFINCLEDLGLLKLEHPKTAYQIIQDVVGDDFLTRDTAQLVLDSLAINGYEVRKCRP